jgi:hypothetical protein
MTLARFNVSLKNSSARDTQPLIVYCGMVCILQFSEGDWAYHDSYLGESDFIGEEIIYFQRQVVWGMNYFGYILQPDRISSAQAGHVIKVSLTRLYEEGRFLGGFEHTVDDLRYVDTSEGDFQLFHGREWIEQAGQIVYELRYHGGLVKS